MTRRPLVAGPVRRQHPAVVHRQPERHLRVRERVRLHRLRHHPRLRRRRAHRQRRGFAARGYAALQDPAHGPHHRRVERLCDVIGRPEFKAQGFVLRAAQRGDDDRRLVLPNQFEIFRQPLVGAVGDQIERPGDARLVAQFGADRQPELPDVPTGAELVSNELDKEMLRFFSLKYELDYAFIIPPGVPPERVGELRQAFDRAMADPEFAADARRQKLTPEPSTGAHLEALISGLYATPKTVIERVGALIK